MSVVAHGVTAGLLAAAGSSSAGKAAFIGVFALLVVVLLSLPRHLRGEGEGIRPWWRNVRVWAIIVALAQIAIYVWWG